MKSEKLSLDHQTLLEEKFKQFEVNLSEYSFANLYLFRDVHEYVLIFNRELFIKGKMRDGRGYLMPTSHPKNWSTELMMELSSQGVCLFPIPEEWLIYFENHLEEYCFCEADSDYLFSIDKLAYYPGRHLSKKRNLVKQLLQNYVVESEPLLISSRHEALKILDLWQNHSLKRKENTDYFSSAQAIELFNALHLEGFIFNVNSEPGGLIIGEWLNSSCYVVHFAKALNEIHGLYPYMYQHLALSVGGKAKYINLEQDLGLLSIRQAKHSYQPDHLLQKYRINLKAISN